MTVKPSRSYKGVIKDQSVVFEEIRAAWERYHPSRKGRE